MNPTAGPRGLLGPTVASIEPESLVEMSQQPEWVQRLIREALNLTTQNLGYLFGSADPAAGGMDCSGTIYYLLQKHGFKDVPRDSRGQYGWLIDKGTLRTVDEEQMSTFDYRALRPGDLLFWTGTYSVNRDVPISHVMLYLGTEKATGKPVMWGASDGRSYGGKQRFGVSVFDFKLPRNESKSRFVGFGQLPGMGKL
jgi:cell wall-associated NlpC family hydrolase